MRELLSMLLALAAIAASGADLRPCWRNLITNFDHRERMGVDLPMGWAKHIKDKVTTKIDVFPQADGSSRPATPGRSTNSATSRSCPAASIVFRTK